MNPPLVTPAPAVWRLATRLLLVALAFLSIRQIPAQTWTLVSNGVPANVAATTVARGPGSTVLAAFNNRVYVSSDNGASWIAKTNGLIATNGGTLTLSSLYASGSTFLRGGRAGTFNSSPGAAIFYSVNSGDLWTMGSVSGGNTSPARQFITLAGNGSTFFAGDQRHGVFRSLDGGVTWTQSNTGIPDVAGEFVIARLLGAHGKVFAAVSSGGGIMVSTDTGASWAAAGQLYERNGTPTTAAIGKDVDLAEDGTLYAMVENAYIFRSTDAGATWYKVSDTIPPMQVAFNFLHTATVANSIFGLGQDYSSGLPVLRLFRSDNRGDTWIEIPFAGMAAPFFNWLESAHGYLYIAGQDAQGFPGLYRLQVAESTPAPALSVSVTSGMVTISWPLSAGDIGLERTSSLNDTWAPVLAPRTTNGATVSVQMETGIGDGFFRLRK